MCEWKAMQEGIRGKWITGNERQEVGCVHKKEASPVLALMVQMRLWDRTGECSWWEEGENVRVQD